MSCLNVSYQIWFMNVVLSFTLNACRLSVLCITYLFLLILGFGEIEMVFLSKDGIV